LPKRVTVKAVAEALGLSPATVSFVLNGRPQGIRAETRQRVIEKAAEMGYRKLPRANMMGWTRVVYLTRQINIFNAHTSFYAGVYNYLLQQIMAVKTELSLRELRFDRGPEKTYLQLQQVRSLGVDVFLTHDRQIAEYLVSQDEKVILVQGGRMAGVTCVFCDDYTAGKLAAEHALDYGHKTAGLIFPEVRDHPRWLGFVDAFTAGGGHCPEAFQWCFRFDHDFMETETVRLAEAAKAELPSLFYCFADNVMYPVMRGLAAIELQVPDDVSLIGTDNLYWGRYSIPALTTVDLCEEFFAEKLLEAVAHVKTGGEPYQLAVPVRLMPRETVKGICSRQLL